MSKTKAIQENIAQYVQQQRQQLGTIGITGKPQYPKPHAWKIMRSNGDWQMAECTKGYAVGQGVRTGLPLPVTAAWYADELDARKCYEEMICTSW